MSTQNTDLFSYLPGLEVTDSELLESELAVQQILKAKFPTLDLREGTALRDLVIRPNATMLSLVNKALMLYFQNNTIGDVDNSTPTTFVDKLLQNWFLERKAGIKAVISARLYFAKAKQINLYTDIFFSTNGTLKFFPASSVTFSPDQLTFEASANQYYLDVDLVGETAGTDYNITTGSLLYFTNFDPFFLRAEINYLRTSAADVESNTEFVARAKNAISTRNLINVPSISTNLMDYFSSLDGVKSVGFGDAEMTRDQIKVLVPGVTDPVWIHNGGCVDVYCRTPVASSIVQLTTDNTGKVKLTGAIYNFARSLITGGGSDDTLPQYVTKSVTSITSAGTVATVTCTAHGYVSGTKVTITGATPAGYNGTFAITNTGANTFTYVIASTLTSPATGTITANVPVPFTWANSYVLSTVPTSITRTGSVATVTSANHGLMVGDRVNVSGANQVQYNGTFVITDVPTRDTFCYPVDSSAVTPAGGVLAYKFIDRQNDVGFSDRQSITVDFGATYASQTVSFTISYHNNIDGYQGYLSDANKRVLCGDLLARGFNLTMLDVVVTAYNGPSPDAQECNDVAIAYLASLSPGQPFVMADLLAKLYAAGITTIKTPVDITYTKYWNDLLGTTTGTITDVLDPADTCNIFVVNSMDTDNQVIS